MPETKIIKTNRNNDIRIAFVWPAASTDETALDTFVEVAEHIGLFEGIEKNKSQGP